MFNLATSVPPFPSLIVYVISSIVPVKPVAGVKV